MSSTCSAGVIATFLTLALFTGEASALPASHATSGGELTADGSAPASAVSAQECFAMVSARSSKDMARADGVTRCARQMYSIRQFFEWRTTEWIAIDARSPVYHASSADASSWVFGAAPGQLSVRYCADIRRTPITTPFRVCAAAHAIESREIP